MKSFQAVIDTPFAQLGIVTREDYIESIDFLPVGSTQVLLSSEFTASINYQIDQYLTNPRFEFNIKLRPSGTEFQQSVWEIMCGLLPGETLTYGDVAQALKSSPRAVGNACRRNPIPLLIPCHRIVAKNGLGGFAGQTSGAVFDIKRWLLRHEMPANSENLKKKQLNLAF